MEAEAGVPFLRACAQSAEGRTAEAAGEARRWLEVAERAAALRRRRAAGGAAESTSSPEQQLQGTSGKSKEDDGSSSSSAPDADRLRRLRAWAHEPQDRLSAEEAALSALLSAQPPAGDPADIRVLSAALEDVRAVLSLLSGLAEFAALPPSEITDARLTRADEDAARAAAAGLGGALPARLAAARGRLWRGALAGGNEEFWAAHAEASAALQPLGDFAALWRFVEDTQAASELLRDATKREVRRKREVAVEAARREEAARAAEEAARAAEEARAALEAESAAARRADAPWLESLPEGLTHVAESKLAYDENAELGAGSLQTVVYQGAVWHGRQWVPAAVKRVPANPGKGARGRKDCILQVLFRGAATLINRAL